MFDSHTHRLRRNAIVDIDPVGKEGKLRLHKGYFYSVGIHPWNLFKATPADIRMLQALAAEPQVLAIGECGLDPKIEGSESLSRNEIIEAQTTLLTFHISISERLSKPLILHIVKAYPEIIALRKSLRPAQPWIIHGFRGNAETARQITSRGIYLSLGEKFNPDAILNIPPHLLLAETDESHTSINSIAAAISPADPTLPFNNLKRLLSTCKK